MIDAIESVVGGTRKAVVQDAHPVRKTVRAQPDNEVIVVPHQRERQDAPIESDRDFAHQAHEELPEFLVEYRLTVVATRDYVIVGAGLLKARFARHWRTVGIRTHRPNQVRKHFAIPVHFFGGAWHRDMAARVLAAVATVRFGR